MGGAGATVGNNCNYYDNRYDRNFNNSVIFIVL